MKVQIFNDVFQMKKRLFFWLMVLGLAGCGQKHGIDRVVEEETDNGLYGSGIYKPIPLPKSATPAEVTSKILGTNMTPLEIRQVFIPKGMPSEQSSYTAVLANTCSGRKVVVMKFTGMGTNRMDGWWYQVYDDK